MYLDCPECGAEALEATRERCLVHDHDRVAGPDCVLEPVWTDGDEVACPGCGVLLLVSADGERAWLTEAA